MKLKYWKNYKDRICREGLLKTIIYYMGSHLLPKAGFQLKYLFEYQHGFSSSQISLPLDVKFSVLHKMSDLEPEDIKALNDFEGRELIDRYEMEFENNHKCAIARKEKCGLVSAGWLTPAPPQFSVDGEPSFLLRDGFTLPNMRGNGVYKGIIRTLCEYVISSVKPDYPHIFVTSVFSNWASIRGIEKSGFKRIGVVVVVWGRQWVHFYK
ncbi:MAG: hypothetical protein ACMUHX_01680 [bacterium]